MLGDLIQKCWLGLSLLKLFKNLSINLPYHCGNGSKPHLSFKYFWKVLGSKRYNQKSKGLDFVGEISPKLSRWFTGMNVLGGSPRRKVQSWRFSKPWQLSEWPFLKILNSISDITDPVKRFDLISFEGDFGGRYYISLTHSTEKFYVCLIDLLLQLHFSLLQNNCFQFAKKKLSSELYLKLLQIFCQLMLHSKAILTSGTGPDSTG